jgi:hypothetical protein
MHHRREASVATVLEFELVYARESSGVSITLEGEAQQC